MSENKDSVDCTRHPYPFPQGAGEKPGDFCWGDLNEHGVRYLYIVLPGYNRPDAIRTKRDVSDGPRCWVWDGNEDKPTLSPSLHWVGHWHGYLKNGRLESC